MPIRNLLLQLWYILLLYDCVEQALDDCKAVFRVIGVLQLSGEGVPAAAPAPQAEGTMTEAEYKAEKEKFDSDWADKVGAAPAETALVGEYSVGNVRVIIRHLGRPEIHECTACGVMLPGPEMWDHVKTHSGETAEQAERRAASELREMQEAAEKLVTKLRRIFDSEEYKGIFTIAHIHGCKYDGENCGEELTAMARLLARKPQ